MEWTRNMKSFSLRPFQQLVSGQWTCNNSGRHALPAVCWVPSQISCLYTQRMCPSVWHNCVCMYVCMYVCVGVGVGVCVYVCVCMWTYSLSELHIYSSLPFVFILFVSGLTFISERHSNSRFLFTTLLTAPTDMPNLAAADRWLEFSAAFRTSKFSDRVKFLLLWRDMVGVSPAESIHELNTTFSVKVIYESEGYGMM